MLELHPAIPGLTSPRVLGFLFDLVVASDASSLIEIGSYMGRSAFAMVLGLVSLSGRRRSLHCIDMFATHLDDQYFAFPLIRQIMRDVAPADALYRSPDVRTLEDAFKKTLDRFPFMKRYITVQKANSREVTLPPGAVFDFAYIDGDHTYDGVKNDFSLVLKSLENGATVVFDDYSDQFPDVVRFVEEIRSCRGVETIGREHPDVGVRVLSVEDVRAQLGALGS
jgi:predicted O-methyltransferase YrrM